MSINYLRSNAIITVSFVPSRKAQQVFARLLRAKTTSERGKLSNRLTQYLSDDADISSVHVTVSATRQYHRKFKGRVVMKRYGYYRPRSHYIYIQNFTAVRAKVLAPKTFVTTLLHEWMHHYDYEKLRLRSIHTKGFYLRLASVTAKLLLRPTQ